jgi:hypothetical protein
MNNEIHRVLNPGGRLVAVDFGATPREGIGHLLWVLRIRTGWDHAERLRAMLREAGFATRSRWGPLVIVPWPSCRDGSRLWRTLSFPSRRPTAMSAPRN